MKHKIALLLGIVVFITGILILFHEFSPVFAPFGSGDRPGYIGDITIGGFIFGISLLFGGILIVYYFVFRKWELEHGSGKLSF
jgi:hypothetical protein